MSELLTIEQHEVKAHCDKHGDYTASRTVYGSHEITSQCPECEAEAKAAEAENFKREAEAEAVHAARAVLPARFAGCTFGEYRADSAGQKKALAVCSRYAERWDDRKAKGGCLVLCGKPGTGKTHLAAAIVREVVRSEFLTDDRLPNWRQSAPVKYTTAAALARKVKSTYSPSAQETEAQVIGNFSTVALLVIDEVGAQRGTETELLLLQEIIDNRYQNVLPTILISNLPEKELTGYIGERALDRLYDNGGAVVAFDWESKRRAANG